MTDHLACVCGHKGTQRGAIGPQRIDDVAFVILPERSAIDAADIGDICGGLRSNFDHAFVVRRRDGAEPRWADARSRLRR